MCRHATVGVGGLKACSPRNFWNLEAMRLLLRPFWAKQCFLEAWWQSFTCMNIYPFCPLCCTALVSASRSLTNLASHTRLHRWGLRDYNHSLGSMESCWKEDSAEIFIAIHSHLTSFNISPVCLRALHGRPPSNGTTWRCQANHEWGKKWNWTNWTSGYGPDVTLMCAARKKWYIESLDIAAVSCVLASDYTATICI